MVPEFNILVKVCETSEVINNYHRRKLVEELKLVLEWIVPRFCKSDVEYHKGLYTHI